MEYDYTDLTVKQRAFAEEYVLSLDAKNSAIRAGYSGGTHGHEVMKLPHVKAYIDYLTEQRAKRLQGIQDQVIEKLWQIASVDANELVQFRRTCCRFCYGENHRYQWTDVEFERARAEAKARAYPPPEAPGGTGYDRAKNPNPDCPECQGEGDGHVFAQDTRNLSPAAEPPMPAPRSAVTGWRSSSTTACARWKCWASTSACSRKRSSTAVASRTPARC